MKKRSWQDWTAAVLVAALAAGLRLHHIADMEYKYDEKTAFELAGQFLRLEKLPLVGLDSSVGIPNPPGFVLIIAGLRVLLGGPLAVGAAIAAVNAGAIVWLGWFLAPRVGGFVSWGAALMMATGPWAVIFSRKIWAQDLLAPFGCVLVAGLILAVQERKPGGWLLVGFGATGLLHLHLSTAFLGVLLPGVVFLWRRYHPAPAAAPVIEPEEKPYLYGALALGLLSLAPYTLLILKNLPSAVKSLKASRPPDFTWLQQARESMLAFSQLCGGIGFETTLGQSAADFARSAGIWMTASAVATGIVAALVLVGWVRAWRRRKKDLVWLYLSTLVALHLAYILFISSRTGASYFLVLYPAPFLLALLALEAIPRRFIRLGLLSGILVIQIATVCLFQSFIHTRGSTLGGYGVPYRHQQAGELAKPLQ
jgi:hypothetical protein